MFFCLFQRRIRDWNRAGSQNATLVNLCDVKFSDTSLVLGNQSVQEDFQAIRYRTLHLHNNAADSTEQQLLTVKTSLLKIYFITLSEIFEEY